MNVSEVPSLASVTDSIDPSPFLNSIYENAVLYDFPEALDSLLSSFDNFFLHIAQAPHRSGDVLSKFFKGFAVTCTALVSIEFIVGVPILLYSLRFDSIASLFSIVSIFLATLSQIPKRFIWRFRPFMVKRAIKVWYNSTSSFPSRAVTCSVVLPGLLLESFSYPAGSSFYSLERWGIILGTCLLISFSRASLGVHYPSDCLFGVILGSIVLIVGYTCSNILNTDCGTYNPEQTLDVWHSNWIALSLFTIGCLLVSVLFSIPPILFWPKSSQIYGVMHHSVFYSNIMTSRNVSPPLSHRFSFLALHSTGHFYARRMGSIIPSPVHLRPLSLLFNTSITSSLGSLSLFSPLRLVSCSSDFP
jgi:membrane-associated phospholipid phosphatase